jgi:hypothetical protein
MKENGLMEFSMGRVSMRGRGLRSMMESGEMDNGMVMGSIRRMFKQEMIRLVQPDFLVMMTMEKLFGKAIGRLESSWMVDRAFPSSSGGNARCVRECLM